MPNLSITKSYADGNILTELDLDNIRTSLQTFFNVTKIDSDNIQDLGITTGKLAAESVTTAKIDDNAVTKDKISTDQQLPPGIVMAFASTTVPTGWLRCDGSPVSRTTYADLFAAIGVAHGNGDGSTTFHLPDYRGRFLRGTDNMGTGAAGRDPNAGTRSTMNSGGNSGNNLGSVQSSQYASHNHSVNDPGHRHVLHTVTIASPGAGSAIAVPQNEADATGTKTTAIDTNNTGITIANDGGSETRPLNAYVHYIIKT